ncbi:MAG: PstS family phosphate ABC transporter substrate-binding protein [Micromonosporaceae bacterium]
MKRNALTRYAFTGVALAALALTACSSNPSSGSAGGGSGSIKIDGSSTVGPLSEAAAALYGDENPDVRVSVGTSGTGGGFEKFCAGETDISDASRPIEDEEKAACEKEGISFTEMTVANDALSVVVSKNTDWVDCLTTEQLKKIWEPGSKVNTWKDVDPSFPNKPLKLYGPGTDSGTFDYFTEEINGEEGASREDYEASEDDNVLVQGVSETDGALGYFGYTYFEENQDKLKVLGVDGGDGCVKPSVDTAQDGTYQPLSRPLFVYVSEDAAKKAHVRKFVEFYVENIDDIITEAHFIPLTEEQKSELTTNLDSLKG